MDSRQRRFHNDCVGGYQDPEPRQPSHPWINKEPHPEQWTLVDKWYMEKRTLRQSRMAWHRAATYRLCHMDASLTKSMSEYPHPVLKKVTSDMLEYEERKQKSPAPPAEKKDDSTAAGEHSDSYESSDANKKED